MPGFDCAIVGAGVAGLSAAKAAARLGLSFVVLEAKGRTGGRAFTETAQFGVPFDHGAHFLHHASRNPFKDYADERGFAYKRGGYQAKIYNGRWLSPVEKTAFDETAKALLTDAGRLGAADPALSVAAALSKSRALNVDDQRLFAGYYDEFVCGKQADVAAADHARYQDTYEDWPVERGYGALVADFGRDVPVRLECPVRSVDATGRAVVLDTPKGAVTARTALVTVSTGVLQSEAITFKRGLPAPILTAIGALPLGYAGKIAFALMPDANKSESHHGIVSLKNGTFANVHVRPFEKPVVTLIVGGAEWDMIERAGPLEMIAAARAVVAEAYGGDFASALGGAVTTAWLSDPGVRGGHSYLRAGYGNARRALSEPIDDRIYFAGEATSQDAWSTVHGARASAEAAVSQIYRSLQMKSRGSPVSLSRNFETAS